MSGSADHIEGQVRAEERLMSCSTVHCAARLTALLMCEMIERFVGRYTVLQSDMVSFSLRKTETDVPGYLRQLEQFRKNEPGDTEDDGDVSI